MTEPDNRSGALETELLQKLAVQFELNVENEGVILELKALFRRYLFDKRAFSDHSKEDSLRESYRRLKSETERFRTVISSSDYVDLETDLYWAAIHKYEAQSNPDISVISGPGANRGHAYVADLEYLLSLLEFAAETGIERFAPAKGRKPNIALKNAVRRIDYIWSETLERRFSVDYHQGSGVTPAFVFVKTIFETLDSEITEKEIITEMRDVISDRNAARKT